LISPMVGMVFGRWRVLRRVENGAARHATYICRCECGREKRILGSQLRRGRSRSCRSCPPRRHGMTNSPTWRTWSGMITRCYNPHAVVYARYGAMGVRICDRWRDSFEAFLADMGPRPIGMSIDRIDNSGNYEPENCRWATATEQACNRRSTRFLTLHGLTHPMAEWARRTGISKERIHWRLKAGWSLEDALSKATR
jgi:hypothetical protein